MNPLLPENNFVPDAEARVMPDGRLYLYGSWDRPENPDYCSNIHHCFSTDDMIHWTDHGVIYRNDEEFTGMPWSPHSNLYAPDAIHKDGKYYLYICGNKNEEGVAVANSPIGPFSVAEKIEIADGDSIDPSVFVDEDGQAYYFWGQFSLRGGKLAEDMKTIIPETVKRDIITEWEHGFHEGASIRKRGNKYYMVYTDISRGKATCLAYSVADHPLGPYKRGGVIIDNIYCDPATWNNHGSIAEFNGSWYVFYHRSSHNRVSCRRVCCEPISFDENGYIKEAEQTSSGAEKFISADCIPARTACRIMLGSHIALDNDREVLISKNSSHWGRPDWAEYKYIGFEGNEKSFYVNVKGKGKITLKLEQNIELCALEFECASFEKIGTKIPSVSGIHPLWLFFEGDITLLDFGFEK